MTITQQAATAIVAPYGYTARAVNCGIFLAPVQHNRFGHRHVGDDVMYISSGGSITLYSDDAQAFLAASVLAHAIIATTKRAA